MDYLFFQGGVTAEGIAEERGHVAIKAALSAWRVQTERSASVIPRVQYHHAELVTMEAQLRAVQEVVKVFLLSPLFTGQ